MKTITTTGDLAAFCSECASQPYVTVDTEFLRERTYYAKLCLVQIARPGEGDETAVLVDTLTDGLDLAPLYDLFRNRNVTKVFHAARQDLEIFFVDGGVIPTPFFDTQVAAMVCGFGDQVGYETLVRKIARQSLDKSSRFTDWSRRPLSEKQKAYALADVTHLREIYEFLAAKLEKSGRTAWVEEELAVLTNPETYVTEPREAWLRLKTRTNSGRFLAVLRELAQFREELARSRDVPRNRILKDDALMEIASLRPKTMEELGKARLVLREARKNPIAKGLLEAVARGEACPREELPVPPDTRSRRGNANGLSDLLRVLLKAKSEEADVAQKLIASASELERLATEDAPDVPALKGWRREVFGRDAQRLKAGEIALSADAGTVRIIELPRADA
ncbi:MAG: ribonuclease D [Paracoccaceae bacterium]